MEAAIRFGGIQILRGAAALGVVLAHLSSSYEKVFNAKDAFPNFWAGNIGVDLFFVISGFIMVYTSERLFGRPGAAKEFLARRLIRIVPLYWAVTTYAIAAEYHWFTGVGTPWLSVLGSYLFLPFPMPSGGPIVIVGWTLNYEMFFYALFAAGLFLRRDIAVALVSAAIIGLVALGNVAPDSHTWRHFTSPLMLEFVLGMWVGLIYARGIRVPTLAVAALFLCGTILVLMGPFTGPFAGAPYVERAVTWGGGFALILASVVLSRRSINPKRWALPILVGDSSYALYLTHWFVVMSPPHFLLSIGATEHPLAYSASIVLMACAVGCAVHLLFEKPLDVAVRRIRRYRERFSPRNGTRCAFPSDQLPRRSDKIAGSRRRASADLRRECTIR